MVVIIFGFLEVLNIELLTLFYLKNIETHEEITMGVPNLAMTYKTDTNSVFISGIVLKSGKLNEKVSKENSIRDINVIREICFIDKK